MIRTQLNEAELKIGKFIGTERFNNDAKAHVHDGRITEKKSSLKISIDGVLAEIAFCKMFNYYPDFTTQPRKGGCDVIGRNGVRIDVKHSDYLLDPYLIVKKTTGRNESDIYALVVGVSPNFYFGGYIYAKDLFREENLKDWGYKGKEAYSIKKNNLLQLIKDNETNI